MNPTPVSPHIVIDHGGWKCSSCIIDIFIDGVAHTTLGMGKRKTHGELEHVNITGHARDSI